MALKRKDVRALFEDTDTSTEEKVAKLMAMHIETVDGLKDEIAALKADSEKLKDTQQKLSELEAQQDKSKGWEDKYKAEHTAFESYKAEQTKEKDKAAKLEAYKPILKEAGISDSIAKLIIAASDDIVDGIQIEDGNVKDKESVTKTVKERFADYIGMSGTKGAKTQTPPGNSGGKMTKEEIMKIKDTADRQKAIAENHELFGF